MKDKLMFVINNKQETESKQQKTNFEESLWSFFDTDFNFQPFWSIKADKLPS